jgi:hypothetical protein
MGTSRTIASAHSATKVAALERKVEELYLLIDALERKLQLQADRITILQAKSTAQ